MTTFIVVLERSDGTQYKWLTEAKSPAKATMAAVELCPDCNILKVMQDDDWR